MTAIEIIFKYKLYQQTSKNSLIPVCSTCRKHLKNEVSGIIGCGLRKCAICEEKKESSLCFIWAI